MFCPLLGAELSGVSLPPVPPALSGVSPPRRTLLSVVCPRLVAALSGVSLPRRRFEWCVPAVGRFWSLQCPGRELCVAANYGGRMPGVPVESGIPFRRDAAVCCGAVLFRCGCFVILGRLRVAVRSGLGRVFFDE
ncbi:MAG: hypothetical protein ACK5MO_01060 [Planctomyces sp.]